MKAMLINETTPQGVAIECIDAPPSMRANFTATDDGLSVQVVAPENLTPAERRAFGMGDA